jgi:hypothetical protein
MLVFKLKYNIKDKKAGVNVKISRNPIRVTVKNLWPTYKKWTVKRSQINVDNIEDSPTI